MTKRLTSPHAPSEQLAVAPMVNSAASATAAFPSGRLICATVIADQRYPHVQAGDNLAASPTWIPAETAPIRGGFTRGGGGPAPSPGRVFGPFGPLNTAVSRGKAVPERGQS